MVGSEYGATITTGTESPQCHAMTEELLTSRSTIRHIHVLIILMFQPQCMPALSIKKYFNSSLSYSKI